MDPSPSRIESLLCEAQAALSGGAAQEAVRACERVLLLEPAHAPAVVLLAAARQALHEEQRALDAQLHRARELFQAGETDTARNLLEDVIARGGDRDAARTLLDRLRPEVGARVAPAAHDEPVPPAPTPGPRLRRGRLSRKVLGAGWTAALVVLSLALGARWEHWLGRLTATPMPSGAFVTLTTVDPPGGAGARAVREARALLASGDTRGALAALAGIAPDDPVFPLASQLRSEAGRTMASERHP